MKKIVRIGTRGSRLARIQADMVKSIILAKNPSLTVEIIEISTKGDVDKTTLLSNMGGKGVFIKELEYALLDDQIDIAVHSFKDVTCELAPGCQLAGFLEAESKHDILVCREGDSLRAGMRIGTGSIRRKALLKHQLGFDVEAVDIRGNVETRIGKCDSGEVDGVMLSEAGLIRLGLEHRITQRFFTDSFYPAPGQGMIALECREGDDVAKTLCESITTDAQACEARILLDILNVVGFDCRDPFGCVVDMDDKDMTLSGFIASHDIQQFFPCTLRFTKEDCKEAVREWVAAIQEKRALWE